MRINFLHFSFLFTGLFLALTLATSEPSKAEATEATTIVESFHGVLLNTMKSAKKYGIQGRYKILEPAIISAFDLQTTVRVAAGRTWRKASDSEKSMLTEAFKHWSISNYASQFKGYSGEGFKTHSEKAGPQKTRLVKTDLQRPGKKPVGLTYVLKQKKKKWRIVDVLLQNSISQLAVRRSEYRGVLADGGISKLIKTLDINSKKLLNP